MPSLSVGKLIEALRCLTLLLEVIREFFPDWAEPLLELEDEMVDKLQELR